MANKQRGFIDYVLPDAAQFFLIADDVFLEVALPDGTTGVVAGFVDASR